MKRNIFKYALWPIYFLSFFGAQYLSNWWTLRVSGIRGGNFIDLGAVLRWSDCFQTIGNSVYGPEDGKCGGYLYGSTLLRVFNFLGISAAQTKFWGLLVGAVICISLGALAIFFANTKGLNLFLVGLILSSPGLWLLVERGNIDELIFLLVLASSVLIVKGLEIPAILLIAISALFKFYTIPLLFVLAVICKTKKTKIFALITFLLTVPLIAVDYLNIQTAFPNTWFVSFGAPSVGFWINLFGEQFGLEWPYIGTLAGHGLGLIILSISVFIIHRFSHNKMKNYTNQNIEIVKKSGPDSFLLLFGSVFLICYLIGMSYDYRLIFAAVSGMFLISRNLDRPFAGIIKGSLLLGLWLSSFSFGITNDKSGETIVSFILIQFVGDIALGVFVAFLSLEIYGIFRAQFEVLRSKQKATS